MPLGDQVDEMEELILNQPELIVYPEVLYKNGGLWFSAITDLPFTGRVEIYSDKKENIKILECTIVKGLKHGVFIQYLIKIQNPQVSSGYIWMIKRRVDGYKLIQ